MTITCTPPTGGLTPGTYKVTVTGSAGSETCGDSTEAEVVVVVSPKPVMTVDGPATHTVRRVV